MFEGYKGRQVAEFSHDEISKESATLKLAKLLRDSKKELAARHEELT